MSSEMKNASLVLSQKTLVHCSVAYLGQIRQYFIFVNEIPIVVQMPKMLIDTYSR